MGLEGLVSKRRDQPYRGGRSKHWIKVKNRKHPAMQRVMDHFQLRRPLTWDQPTRAVLVARLRHGVRDRLAKGSDSATESDPLALADAQLLVARSLGFEGWEQLAAQTEE